MTLRLVTTVLLLYAYNRVSGSSPDLGTWTFTREYAGRGDAAVDDKFSRITL